MVIEYNKKYKKEVVILIEELQKYIASIDKEKYNRFTKGYGGKYLDKTLRKLKNHNGKMFLYEEDGKILGLIAGIVNNEEIDVYDFKAPKRGRILELIVTENTRGKGIGKILIKHMEEYLKSIGCKAVLLEVFGYNDNAIKFYTKNEYHNRLHDMIKLI